MGKFGHPNEVKLDPLKYNIGLLGESGIGKTTLIRIIMSFMSNIQGDVTFYNEKGEMICECVYENGIRNGWIREYNNNQTISIGICKNGEKVSTLLPYRGNRGFNEEIQNNERESNS